MKYFPAPVLMNYSEMLTHISTLIFASTKSDVALSKVEPIDYFSISQHVKIK